MSDTPNYVEFLEAELARARAKKTEGASSLDDPDAH